MTFKLETFIVLSIERMDVVKVHLLVTIIATQLVALFYDRKVPYFPIEISRTAASGQTSLLTFRVGVLSILLTLFWTGHLTLTTFILWIGLSIVAVFDDVSHWGLHMMGVAVVFTVMAVRSIEHGSMPVIYAVIIYGVRFLLDAATLVTYEKCAFSPSSFTALHKDIMYRGAVACKRPDVVIPVYRIGGVLQWAAFYALSYGF